MWFLTILSCLFLLLPQESFFPLPTPENHRLELLVVELPIAVQVTSLARRRELQLFGTDREKNQQFCNFCICGWPMCIAIYQPPSLFRILRIIRCIFEIIFDQYVSGRKGLESGEHSSEKSSHLENQVNCFPAHEL